MNSEEAKLANQIIIENKNGNKEACNKLLRLLTQSFDDNYKNRIINIIKKKYTFNEEKEEFAKDIYSEAWLILLNNINKDVKILEGLKYENYILGICRNLYYEKARKNNEINYEDTFQYEDRLVAQIAEEDPFESEEIQKIVEDALITYYEQNDMIDCLKILYYSWKKELKNPEIAELLSLEISDQKEASRRITVIQQNCIKNAWRNIGLLHEVKKKYHIKKRKKIYWKRNAGNK